MTIDELVSYGFREWPIGQHDKHDRHWQYCVRDRLGKKLYVQVRFWQFSKYSRPDYEAKDSFDAYCQFDMNGPKTFNVDISVNDMTPQQVIDWFENMHVRMNCTYYEISGEFDDEGNRLTYNCEGCGAYLPQPTEPYLCSACQYQKESGFKQPVPVRKLRRRA